MACKQQGRPAASYAEIVAEVDAIMRRHVENDPAVTAYKGARAFLLVVRGLRGPTRTAELIYKLADEFAAEDAA